MTTRFALAPAYVAGLLAVAAGPVPVRAQAPDSELPRPPAMRTRAYYGMWSTHLRDLDRGLQSNALIGVAYRGYFGATFINSFGDRAVSLGVQRNFSAPQRRTLTTALGYRAGIITGYDERFFGIGDKLPVMPFIQLVGGVDYRKLGLEVGYAGVVASLMGSVRM